MIKLLNGSIFSSKCDLIIIPCNNFGGISRSVMKDLATHDLPCINKEISFGDIIFIQNMGSFSNALMIGYAASVDVYQDSSSTNGLKSIMKKIREFCEAQSVQKVNIPLLGTGAGGLSAKESYNVMKAEFYNDPNIVLCVYTLSEKMFKEIATEISNNNTDKIENPRVFISYTGYDINNRNWVRNFACRLRKSGINARLDVFHLKPGQDLPQWMTNELIMADKVLLICDKYYAEKADNKRGGVGWESMIIQGDMMLNQERNKYIAIIRDSNIDQSLPIYIRSRYALSWVTDDDVEKGFDDMLLYLFDCDIEPPIGEIPLFVKEKIYSKL